MNTWDWLGSGLKAKPYPIFKTFHLDQAVSHNLGL